MSEYNILVVEDSSVMRQLIKVALGRLSIALVDEANNGVEGLKKHRKVYTYKRCKLKQLCHAALGCRT